MSNTFTTYCGYTLPHTSSRIVHVFFKDSVHVPGRRRQTERAIERQGEGGVYLQSGDLVQLWTPQFGFESNLVFNYLRAALQTAWNWGASLRKWLFKTHTALTPLSLLHSLHVLDWRHVAETHRGGLSSVCPCVNGNPALGEERGESAQKPRSSGAPGGEAKGILVENKSKRNRKQSQTWVYRLTLCICPPRSMIGTSKCVTGISAGLRAPSTGPSTSCRNAGGRPDVLLIQTHCCLLILTQFLNSSTDNYYDYNASIYYCYVILIL